MVLKINLEKSSQAIASNQCCRCDYQWQDQPYGLAKYHACPKCNSAYWVWVNFSNDD